jgi:hypothetical protein
VGCTPPDPTAPVHWPGFIERRSQPTVPIPRPSPASPFALLVVEHLKEAFRLDPLSATAAGIHDHDDRWPDLSDAGRTARLTWIAGRTTRLLGG